MCTICGVLSHFALFCCKNHFSLQFTLVCREIYFVAIYVLMEKIEPKIVPMEKNDKNKVCMGTFEKHGEVRTGFHSPNSPSPPRSLG